MLESKLTGLEKIPRGSSTGTIWELGDLIRSRVSEIRALEAITETQVIMDGDNLNRSRVETDGDNHNSLNKEDGDNHSSLSKEDGDNHSSLSKEDGDSHSHLNNKEAMAGEAKAVGDLIIIAI